MLSYRIRARLSDARAFAARAISCGPAVCLRLAGAAALGLGAAVVLVLFVLLALALLVPTAVSLILLAGGALLAWPFKLGKEA